MRFGGVSYNLGSKKKGIKENYKCLNCSWVINNHGLRITMKNFVLKKRKQMKKERLNQLGKLNQPRRTRPLKIECSWLRNIDQVWKEEYEKNKFCSGRCG